MPSFRFVSHMALDTQHIIGEVCVEYPAIHREIVTKYGRKGPVKGSARIYYFVDVPFDKAEYTTFEAALAALEAAAAKPAAPEMLGAGKK